MNSSQIKALEKLKRGHTELHRIIEKYEHSTPTNFTKYQLIKTICSLIYATNDL